MPNESDSDLRGTFLLHEYDALSRLVRLFFTMRTAVLGITLTAMVGVLGVLYSDASAPTAADGSPAHWPYDVLLLIIAGAGGLMLVAVVRSSYVFQCRLARIASEFDVVDYWTTWPVHAGSHPKDSGTRAFQIAARFMCLVVLLHVLLQLGLHLKSPSPLSSELDYAVLIGRIAIAALVMILDGYIRRHVSPKHFQRAMAEAWSQSERKAHCEPRPAALTTAAQPVRFPKVLALIGSPRRGGNTHTMAKELLRGAETEGAETEEIFLDFYCVRPAAEVDDDKERRVDERRDDDFPRLLDRFIESDVVVWASPVYWRSMTAQLKLFCDRLGAYCYRPEYRDRIEKQLYVAVCACENEGDHKFVTGAIEYLAMFTGAKFGDSVAVSGVADMGSIEGRRELRKCREMGARLIRELRSRAGET